MFKITCDVANQQNIFYLSNVNQDVVEKVANVLANNLSFDENNIQPTVSSIVKTDVAETPLFDYIGVEILSGDIATNQDKYRKELFEQGIMTGAVHNFGNKDKNKNTELYKFKVIKE